MQEFASPDFTREVGGSVDREVKDAAIERILADFREWLTRTSAVTPSVAPTAKVDLATLAGSFLALRQEVNLQTRASRTQVEQNAQAFAKLDQTLAAASVSQPIPQPAASAPPSDSSAAIRPLLKALVDIRDALGLAEKHVSKTKISANPPPAPAIDLKLPAWTRWFDLEDRVRAAIEPLQKWAESQSPHSAQQATLDSLTAGYTMSMQRLDRALQQQGLERIHCLGQPFDPEIMEVVEVVKDPSRTGTEVIEDVRPGYRYQGQLFRCAQVRVARS